MRSAILCVLLAGCSMGHALAEQLTDAEMLAYLKSISFPLYQTDDPAEPIRCIGWNGASPKSGTLTFSVTAAHCDGLLALNRSGRPFDRMSTRFTVWVLGYDQHIFSKPSCGDTYPAGFSTSLTKEETYYTLGHRTPKDPFEELSLVKLRFVEANPDDGLTFVPICAGDECQVNMLPGVSGAPVISARREVVGSYYGFSAFEPGKPKVSPIDLVSVFLRAAASSNVKIKSTYHCQ